MPNSHKFAKIFQDLGVPHIVSFKAKPKLSNQVIRGDDLKQLE